MPGREATQWKPGQSGNPGGRPKNHGEAQSLARQKAGEAIYALVQQLHDRRIAARERRAAARMLIRIGFGPRQSGMVVLQELGWQAVRQTLMDAANADQQGNTGRARLISQQLR